MLPYFSDENGNYSAKLYNRTSEATRNTIKKDLENKLAWTRYYEDVFGTDALKTDGYFEGLTCLQYYGNYVQLLQKAQANWVRTHSSDSRLLMQKQNSLQISAPQNAHLIWPHGTRQIILTRKSSCTA